MTEQDPLFQHSSLLASWLKTTTWIGIASFGASGRLLLFQEALVEKKKWISDDEFREIVTVSQLFPGPNLVNFAAYFGYREFGFFVSLLSILTLCLPGALFSVLLLLSVPIENSHVRTLFQGFSLGSLTVFLFFSGKMAAGLKSTTSPLHPLSPKSKKLLGRLLLTGIVMGMSLLQIPLIWIFLVGTGVGACVEFFVKDD